MRLLSTGCGGFHRPTGRRVDQALYRTADREPGCQHPRPLPRDSFSPQRLKSSQGSLTRRKPVPRAELHQPPSALLRTLPAPGVSSHRHSDREVARRDVRFGVSRSAWRTPHGTQRARFRVHSRKMIWGASPIASSTSSALNRRSDHGAQAAPTLHYNCLRHTPASHGCCPRGNPVGR